MAMPAVSRTTSQTTPARPSISPLSSASKTLKSSPIATRDSTIHDIEAQFNSEMGVEEEDMEVEADNGGGDDGRSSSLSEPEDEDEDDEEEDDEGGEEEEEGDDVDLSASQRARKELEVDSEAETERLDQTPQKLRKQTDAMGRTPSKLSQAATAEDELSDPPSPLPAGVGAASSTSTVATAGQKRKRSDTADSPLTSAESDIGESPRKRSHEMHEDTVLDADDDAEPSTEVAEQPGDSPVPETTPIPLAKPGRGRKGKPKGFPRKANDDASTPQPTTISDHPDVDSEALPDEHTVATETEPEDLAALKTAADLYTSVASQFRAFREKLNTERLASLAAELHLLSQPDCTHPEYVRQVAAVDARLQKQVREAHAHYNYRMRAMKERVLGERAGMHTQFYQSVREIRETALDKLGEEWFAIQKDRRGGNEVAGEAAGLYRFEKDRAIQIKRQAKYNREVSVLSGIAKWVGFPAAPDLEGVDHNAVERDFRAMKLSKRIVSNAHPPTNALAAAQSAQRAPSATPAGSTGGGGAPPLYLSGQSTSTSSHQPLTTSTPSNTTLFAQTAARNATAANATDERLAHEQFIEQNAWARPPSAPLHHSHSHGIGAGIGGLGVAHTPDWAEPVSVARGILRNREFPGYGSSPAGERKQDEQGYGSSPLGSASKLLARKEGEAASNVGGWRNFSGVSAVSGASTIDAPLPANDRPDERAAQEDRQHDFTRERGFADAAKRSGPPDLLTQYSAPGQAFDTSQIHRHPADGGDVQHAGLGMRPVEGAFGTPVPASVGLSGGAPGANGNGS